METIELEEGWLVRQMQEVRRETQDWPAVMEPITSINASLVHQLFGTDENPVARNRQPVSENSESGK